LAPEARLGAKATKVGLSMFDTVFVVMDNLARPVLLLPEDLPQGNAFLNIVEGGIDIGVGEKVLGQIRDMDEESLMMLGLQAKIGMATLKGKKNQPLPEKIQYVADVHDTRFE
jgi:hypothetical protein